MKLSELKEVVKFLHNRRYLRVPKMQRYEKILNLEKDEQVFEVKIYLYDTEIINYSYLPQFLKYKEGKAKAKLIRKTIGI